MPAENAQLMVPAGERFHQTAPMKPEAPVIAMVIKLAYREKACERRMGLCFLRAILNNLAQLTIRNLLKLT